MRSFELGAVSVVVLGSMLAWSMPRRSLAVDRLPVQAAFGLAAGVLCAVAILSPRIDVVPDEIEPAAAVAGFLSLLAGLWLVRWVRS